MRSVLVILLLAFITASLPAQNFFDPLKVQEIKITFYQNDWDRVLDSLKAANESVYLLVPKVEVNGLVFDSVGVKYKGNSTYKAGNAKNPLHIELDFIKKKQDYNGITDIKLSNCWSDPSFIREPISYEILRQYMVAPQANHAKVWMNGQYWGVYVNQESIDKRFVRRYLDKAADNPFFKCNPEQIGGPGTGGSYPDLVYSSADSSIYYKKYELRSDYGWRELLLLMETLKNRPNEADKILDIDRTLWMLAFNNVFVNLDSYTGAFAQNYYLYMDNNGRFIPIVWDLNMSFGAFSAVNVGGGAGGNLTLDQRKTMDPLLQSTNANRPLIQKLLANASWKKMYLAHLKTILEENFSNTEYVDRCYEWQSLIDADVLADTKKFYTYQGLKDNVTKTYTPGNIPGIADLMNARYNYLKGNANLTTVQPAISLPTAAQAGKNVQVSVKVEQGKKVWVAYRYDTLAVFQRSDLFDDGQHNDGGANDGIYGGTFPVGGLTAQYYYYAENDNAAAFLPQRAEYEFFVVNTKPPLPLTGELVINELLADNENGTVDEAGQNEDWLELYNNSNQPVLVSGLFLTDNPANLAKWAFPGGLTLAPKSYLMVWLDEDGTQGPLHASFKLSAAGETLLLTDGVSVILDQVTFGAQNPDISYGRYPNGTGNFRVMPTTFGKENSLTSSTYTFEKEAFVRISPNPVTEVLYLEAKSEIRSVQFLDLLGRVVYTGQYDDSHVLTLPLPASLENGIYVIKVNGLNAGRVVVAGK